MSFLGAIRVELQARDNQVIAAAVTPEKELKVEQLLINKTPVEALNIISLLFSLCPKSQKAACEAAAYTAEHGSLNEALKDRLARQVLQERISEGFRFFVLQLAPQDYRNKNAARIASVWKLINKLQTATEDKQNWTKEKNEVSKQVLDLLLEDLSSQWESDLLNGPAAKENQGIPAVFARLSQHRTIGLATAQLLKVSNDVFLADLKRSGQKVEDLVAGTFDYISGAVSRTSSYPTVNALLASDGDSAYTRLVARFSELIADLKEDPSADMLISTVAIKTNSAISLIQNSRGVLVHSVDLVEGNHGGKTIQSYCILTPTEINVTRSVSFIDSLVGLKAETEKELEELARLVVLSYDPCTEIKVVISHA